MGDISIKGKSPILRQGYKKGGTVKVRDINKDGKNFNDVSWTPNSIRRVESI